MNNNIKDFSTNKEFHNTTLAKLYQLQAINMVAEKKNTSAINFYKKSNNLLDESSHEKSILLLENQLLEAALLLKIEKVNQAEVLINSVFEKLKKYPNDFIFAYATEIQSRILFHRKNYQQAIDVLQIALEKINGKEFLPLTALINESLSKNYLAIRDKASFFKYNKLYLENKNKLDTSQKEGIRFLMKFLETNQNLKLSLYQSDSEKSIRNLALICAVLVISGFAFYYQTFQKNKDLEKQFSFLNNQRSHWKSQNIKVNEEPLAESEKQNKKTLIISKEKEEEILSKLAELESSNRFLNKDMSLALLASQLETNTKYLSEIINKYKGKNFNTYINELKINYIAFVLKTQPEFLNYKVSYLAEYSGFSSHSSFTTVFKTITGMSPNAFINQINSKNE